jgi:GH15 family glucan-1,4-alpha-glucosidase
MGQAGAVASRIEDYALIGDTTTAALVGRDGSIDWLCLPCFDQPACFASLLGDESNGRWQIAPSGPVTSVTRHYRGDTLVLETEFTTPDGVVSVVDCMPVRAGPPTVIRVVEGRSGVVAMTLDLRIRFDYGSLVPWVRAIEGGIVAVGGADAVVVRGAVPLHGQDRRTVASFDAAAGDRLAFSLSWFPSFESTPTEDELGDPVVALARTEAWWRDWSRQAVVPEAWAEPARTYAPSGGIVAAPTTSLPEQLGGPRNWDYRYCWLRDATFTLHAMLGAGFRHEAEAWSAWLRRAVAGDPDDLQIMYGITGRRRLSESELGWLPGYEGSSPVRLGNAASEQFQLDVYGETLDMLLTGELHGIHLHRDTWDLARFLVEHVRRVWTQPDEGIWEVRGPRRHFVHSKVMAWVAVDRWVRLLDHAGPGNGSGESPDDDPAVWRSLAGEIHADICTHGVDAERGCLTQYYGSAEVDASLLMLPLVGFLPADDPRMAATVAAIEQDLLVDGFVRRYRTEVTPAGSDGQTLDGLPPGEGAFFLTTFWFIDNLVLQGRMDEARDRFEQLLGLANDVGLLAEEWDVEAGRMVGNFPQAFSHIGLLNTAANLERGHAGPARCRAESRPHPTRRSG